MVEGSNRGIDENKHGFEKTQTVLFNQLVIRLIAKKSTTRTKLSASIDFEKSIKKSVTRVVLVIIWSSKEVDRDLVRYQRIAIESGKR